MNDYHEPYDVLEERDRDIVRALASLKEEIEAVNWYHQRTVVTKDEALRAILAHNRDEEIEHACMAIEWLRRVEPAWDAQLRKLLFIDGPIADEDGGHVDSETTPESDLGIADLTGG